MENNNKQMITEKLRNLFNGLDSILEKSVNHLETLEELKIKYFEYDITIQNILKDDTDNSKEETKKKEPIIKNETKKEEPKAHKIIAKVINLRGPYRSYKTPAGN